MFYIDRYSDICYKYVECYYGLTRKYFTRFLLRGNNIYITSSDGPLYILVAIIIATTTSTAPR